MNQENLNHNQSNYSADNSQPSAERSGSSKTLIMVLTAVIILLVLLSAGLAWALLTADDPEEMAELEERLAEKEGELEEVGEKVEENDEQAVDWTEHRNEKHGFELQYPDNWDQQEIKEGPELPMSNLGHIGSYDFYGVNKAKSGVSVSIWDTSTYSFDDLKQPPSGGIDPESVEKEEITISDHSAVKFSYTTVSDVEGAVPTLKVSVSKEDLVYTLECRGEKCDQVISLFELAE